MTDASSSSAGAREAGAASRRHGRAAAEEALVAAHRDEWAFVLAATVRVVRDLDVAEDCVQEAYAAALERWADDGVPANPAAWLTTTARRRGIDLVRREQTLRTKLPLLVEPDPDDNGATTVDEEDPMSASTPIHDVATGDEPEIGDERLRLVFLCCHPALSREAQVALTLRLVCGIDTPDIARTFLVAETTMAARLTRAKKKIAGSRIPFRLPSTGELAERLPPALDVTALLLGVGHMAPSGADLTRADVTGAAVRLARTLHALLPEQAEVTGLACLADITQARQPARTAVDGRLLRLDEQDRSRWDHQAITAAGARLHTVLGAVDAGRYCLQAAIAYVYSSAPTFDDTDWDELVGLYDALLQLWPSPVVALNRAIPISYRDGPATALVEVDRLADDPHLERYPYLPAVQADLYRRLGRHHDAATAYQHAAALSANHVEHAYLTEQHTLAGLEP